LATWYTAEWAWSRGLQRQPIRCIPHGLFRILLSAFRILPTPVSVGVRTPLIARLLFSMTPTLVVFVYYYLCIIFTLVLHYQLSHIKEFTCNTQQTNYSENSCKQTPPHKSYSKKSGVPKHRNPPKLNAIRKSSNSKASETPTPVTTKQMSL